MSDRAWLVAICLSKLGTMLVFSSISALLPILKVEWGLSNTEAGLILGASPDSRWLWAFGRLGLVALAGPLAVGFKEFSPRKSAV